PLPISLPISSPLTRFLSPSSPQSHRPDKEWPLCSLRFYLGVKKKLRPPTCWGFTVFHENEKHERQQWYLCCNTQAEMREWFATYMHAKTGGSLWPSQSLIGRPSRRSPDPRLSAAPLIPLRPSDGSDPQRVSGAAP
ncbi:arf-GAP with Rho-GAP domain, ANK repeat and PH domain-containing protein 1-like, partial [Coturnix japonica]